MARSRWPRNVTIRMKTIEPPTATLRPSIVLVNHSGSAETGPTIWPATPEVMNTAR